MTWDAEPPPTARTRRTCRTDEPPRRARAGGRLVAVLAALSALALACGPLRTQEPPRTPPTAEVGSPDPIPPASPAPCEPVVESQDGYRTAALRVHRDDLRDCTVSEASYREVLGDWLAARPAAADPLESVFLGRAVEYPWISDYLARAALASSEWDAERGAPREGHENTFVAVLLSDPALHERLAAPFEGTAYGIRSISVEKVRVGDAGEQLGESRHDGAKVPYDAQVWILVARRAAPAPVSDPAAPPPGVRPD